MFYLFFLFSHRTCVGWPGFSFCSCVQIQTMIILYQEMFHEFSCFWFIACVLLDATTNIINMASVFLSCHCVMTVFVRHLGISAYPLYSSKTRASRMSTKWSLLGFHVRTHETGRGPIHGFLASNPCRIDFGTRPGLVAATNIRVFTTPCAWTEFGTFSDFGGASSNMAMFTWVIGTCRFIWYINFGINIFWYQISENARINKKRSRCFIYCLIYHPVGILWTSNVFQVILKLQRVSMLILIHPCSWRKCRD